MSGTDRLLGGLFGAARGLVLVVATLLVAGFTPIPADPWWRESGTIERMMPLVDWSAQLLPENVREHLDSIPARMMNSPMKNPKQTRIQANKMHCDRIRREADWG